MKILKENIKKAIKVSKVEELIDNYIKEADSDNRPKNVLFFGNFCGRCYNPIEKWQEQQNDTSEVKVYIYPAGLSPLRKEDPNGYLVITDIYTFSDDMMNFLQKADVLYIKYFGSSNEEFYRELYSILKDRKYSINIQGGNHYDLKNIKLVICDEMEDQTYPDYLLELFDIYFVLDD